MTPFVWLTCSSFKDKRVFNEYSFLPPVHSWKKKTFIEEKDIRQWTELIKRLNQANVSSTVVAKFSKENRILLKSLNKKIISEENDYQVAQSSIANQIETLEKEMSRDDVLEKLYEKIKKEKEDLEKKSLTLEVEYQTSLKKIISPEEKEEIILAFNEIVGTPNWYKEVGFEKLVVTPEITKLKEKVKIEEEAKQAVKEKIQKRLNRLAFEAIFPTEILISRSINLDSFRRLFEAKTTLQGKIYFWQYIFNSIFLTTAITFIQLVFCSMGGFALSTYKFKGRSVVIVFMLGSLMVPPMMLFPPLFALIVKINWMDSFLALVVPASVSAYGIFLFRQAMIRIPKDLIESARIDGSGEFNIYLQIMMPLVKPMTGAFCLITFLFQWNNFIGPQIFLHSQAKLTLPVVLTEYMGVYSQEYGVFLAGTFISILPPALLFFLLQREFISGLSTGALKE